MASAAFTINGTAVPAAVATTYGATVTLALASTVGAVSIEWAIAGVSGAAVASPTISRSGTPLGATATFTVGSDPGDGMGIGYGVRCRVRDGNAQVTDAYGVVGVANTSGRVPIVAGEELWRSGTVGYLEEMNRSLNPAGNLAPGTSPGDPFVWTGSSYAARSREHVNVRDYGAIGDGVTDDTAAIQAAIDAAAVVRRPTVLLPPGLYRITAPIELHDLGSQNGTLMHLRGTPSGSNSGAAEAATTLLWDGGAGTCAIECFTRDSVISDIAIRCAAGASLVTAIDIDASAEAGAGICTGNTFRGITVTGAKGTYGTIQHAFRIGHSGATNCEFMTFEDCGGFGLSEYLVFIDNDTAQSMMHRLIRCACNSTVTQSPKGFLRMSSGSFSAHDCTATDCSAACFVIEHAAWREPIAIENFQEESSARMLLVEQRGVPVLPSPIVFRGGRFSIGGMAADGEFFRVYPMTPLTLDGVHIAPQHSVDNRIFKIKMPHARASLVVRGCMLPHTDPFDCAGTLVSQGNVGATYTAPDYLDQTGWAPIEAQSATGVVPGETLFAGAAMTDIDWLARWSALGLSGAQATLTDLTGNGYTLTSVGTTNIATVGGKDALVFDTTNYMWDATPADLATALVAGDWSVAIRVRMTDTASTYTLVTLSSGAADGRDRVYTSGTEYWQQRNDDGGTSYGPIGGAVDTAADQTIVYIWDDTLKLGTLYVDGEARIADPYDFTAAGATTLVRFVLGALLRTTATQHAKCSLREAAVIDRKLTGYEIQMLRALWEAAW